MGYTDTLLLVILVALCLIAYSSCCDEDTFVACQRQNMMCLKSVCTCTGNGPHDFVYAQVFCANVTEVPKEFPKGVYTM